MDIFLKSPIEETPFETSMMHNNCWRVDIFPKNLEHIRLNLKFCTKNKEKNLIVRQYTYIMDVKLLGEKNAE
jgi:hypothetical protein